MTNLPAPLTPADCDLTDFPYMELDVRRLRDSKFASTPKGDAFRAGILLWCAAWHQKPAASLPDDDVELASLAGYGRMPFSVKEWRKVRIEALHGFVKCSDGRLYHAIIAEKAVHAFIAKGKFAYGKFCDRMRKENKAREAEGKTKFGIPTIEQWNSGAYPHGIPPEIAPISAGVPAEIALKGNREGEGEGEGEGTNTVPIGTDGAAVQPDMTKDELWKAGKSLLSQSGLPPAQCGSFVGKLVKDYGDQIVVGAVRAAVVARPADPVEYLKAACMRAAGQRGASEPAWRAEQRARTQQAAPGVAAGAIPANQFFAEMEASHVAPRLVG